jgi:hypothetical protein
MSESAEQMKLVERCRVADWKRRESGLPEFGSSRIFAIPNGGLRTKSQAAKLKAEGVRAGVSDLFLPVPKVMVPFGHDDKFPGVLLTDMTGKEIASVCCGLWIEMKAGKGKESPEQIAFGHEAVSAGYGYAVCWSAEDAWKVVCDYLGIDVDYLGIGDGA